MEVGDKVKLIGTCYENPRLAIGQTGVVVCTSNYDLDMIEVAMDNGYCNPPDDPSWPFCASMLEVI